VDDRRTSARQWAVAAASAVVPFAVVLFFLPQGLPWILLALVGGVAASVALVELGQRYTAPAKEKRK
jgi:glycopeptide antibiotics resistance protein